MSKLSDVVDVSIDHFRRTKSVGWNDSYKSCEYGLGCAAYPFFKEGVDFRPIEGMAFDDVARTHPDLIEPEFLEDYIIDLICRMQMIHDDECETYYRDSLHATDEDQLIQQKASLAEYIIFKLEGLRTGGTW